LTTQNWKDRTIKHLLYPNVSHLGLPFSFPAFSSSFRSTRDFCEFGAQSEGATEPPSLPFAKRDLSNIMSLPFSNFSYFLQHSGHCHCKAESHLQYFSPTSSLISLYFHFPSLPISSLLRSVTRGVPQLAPVFEPLDNTQRKHGTLGRAFLRRRQ
jgi:hypothetical protein